MAKRSNTTTTGGDPRLHGQVRGAFRGKQMFLDAFEHTPVLDPTELLEALKWVRKGGVKEDAAFKSLLKFSAMVKTVGEMSALFGLAFARDHHGLSQEDFDFVVGCWERAGRPRSGAVLGW